MTRGRRRVLDDEAFDEAAEDEDAAAAVEYEDAAEAADEAAAADEADADAVAESAPATSAMKALRTRQQFTGTGWAGCWRLKSRQFSFSLLTRTTASAALSLVQWQQILKLHFRVEGWLLIIM